MFPYTSTARYPFICSPLAPSLHLHCTGLWFLTVFIHAHGHVYRLRAVRVAYKHAVVAWILHADWVDGESRALVVFAHTKAPCRDDLPVVLQPEHLRHGVTLSETGQTQRLGMCVCERERDKEREVGSEWEGEMCFYYVINSFQNNCWKIPCLPWWPPRPVIPLWLWHDLEK